MAGVRDSDRGRRSLQSQDVEGTLGPIGRKFEVAPADIGIE